MQARAQIELEIRNIATVMGLNRDGALNIDPIVELQRQSPDIYVALRDRIAGRDPARRLSEPELANLTREILTERALRQQYCEAARNACAAFSAIAQITGSKSTARIASVASAGVAIYGSYQTMTAVVAANGGLAGAFAANPVGLANPMFAIASSAAALLGSFMNDDGGMEEFMQAIMQQLQVISAQIRALHEDMVRQFGAVHEHLTEIHRTLCDGIVHLDNLIRNEVQGMRAEVVGRLDNIADHLNRTRQALAKNDQNILTQELRRLLVHVGARLRREAALNEHVEVQKIATELLDSWILDQAASTSLNGICWYDEQHGNLTADWINKILSSADHSNIQQLFGFLARFAVEHLGLDNLDEQRFNIATLVHPGIFSAAVVPYLLLRDRLMQEDFIADPDGRLLTNIITFGQNSLNFISKVRNSNALYTNLFARYQAAVAKVNAAFSSALDSFNQDFNASLHLEANRSINLADDLQTIINKFAGATLRNPVAKHEKLGNIPLNGTLYDAVTMPKEALCAESLGVGSVSINCAARRDVQSIVGRSFIVNDLAEFNYCIKFTGGKEEQLFLKRVFAKNTTVDNYNIADQHATYRRYPISIDNIKSLPCQVHEIIQAQVAVIRKLISNYILSKRKEFIAELLRREAFNTALVELDAAVNLIKAYASLAGFPQELQQSLNNLCTQTTIINQMQNYIRAATIDTLLLQLPTLATINATKAQTLALVARSQRGEVVFASPLQQILQRRIDETGLLRAAFREHLLANRLRQQMPQPAAAQNLEDILDIDYRQILHDHNHATKNLVNAIIQRDVLQVTRFSANREINLVATLGNHSYIPLHIATYIGNVNVVTVLTRLDRVREAINAEDADGNTALMLAAQQGHLPVVQHLAAILATNIDHRNDAGHTAQDLARNAGHADMVILLERLHAERARNAAGAAPGAQPRAAANDDPQAGGAEASPDPAAARAHAGQRM